MNTSKKNLYKPIATEGTEYCLTLGEIWSLCKWSKQLETIKNLFSNCLSSIWRQICSNFGTGPTKYTPCSLRFSIDTMQGLPVIKCWDFLLVTFSTYLFMSLYPSANFNLFAIGRCGCNLELGHYQRQIYIWEFPVRIALRWIPQDLRPWWL